MGFNLGFKGLMSLEFYNDTRPPAVIVAGNAAFVTTVIDLEHDFY